MKKIKLQFMVVPEQLATMAYVPDAVRVKIVDPEAIFLTGLLGESGRKLVKAGVEFYFTKELANKLIEKNIAVEVKTKAIVYPKPIPDGGCEVDPNVSQEYLQGVLDSLSEQQTTRMRRENLLD